MFRLTVHTKVNTDTWMCSPGYSLLNEITNVKSFIKDNMNSRWHKMGQKASSFCPGISTQKSHSQSLDPLNIFTRLLLKLTIHTGSSWLYLLGYFWSFSVEPECFEDLLCSVHAFTHMKITFLLKGKKCTIKSSMTCSNNGPKYFLPGMYHCQIFVSWEERIEGGREGRKKKRKIAY